MSFDLIKYIHMLRTFQIPLHLFLLYFHMSHLFILIYYEYGFPICHIFTTHSLYYFTLCYFYILRIVLAVYMFIDHIQIVTFS